MPEDTTIMERADAGFASEDGSDNESAHQPDDNHHEPQEDVLPLEPQQEICSPDNVCVMEEFPALHAEVFSTSGMVDEHQPIAVPDLPNDISSDAMKFERIQSESYFRHEIKRMGGGGRHLVAESFYQGMFQENSSKTMM